MYYKFTEKDKIYGIDNERFYLKNAQTTPTCCWPGREYKPEYGFNCPDLIPIKRKTHNTKLLRIMYA